MKKKRKVMKIVSIRDLKLKELREFIDRNGMRYFRQYIPLNFAEIVFSYDKTDEYYELMNFIFYNINDMKEILEDEYKDKVKLLHKLLKEYETSDAITVDLENNDLYINSEVLDHFVEGDINDK